MLHPLAPRKPVVLSLLPARDWFTVEQAAQASGWGVTCIRERIKDGTLAAQQWQGKLEQRAGRGGLHVTYRIHVDDLVLFIIRHGRVNLGEEKPVQDLIAIVRTWPRWLLRHLHTALGLMFSKTSPGTGPHRHQNVPTSAPSRIRDENRPQSQGNTPGTLRRREDEKPRTGQITRRTEPFPDSTGS